MQLTVKLQLFLMKYANVHYRFLLLHNVLVNSNSLELHYCYTFMVLVC